MTKKIDKRQQMIETALDLFHQRGIVAVSVDDILSASGTGKGQFYHYFKSKDGLIHEVLTYFYDRLKTNSLPGKVDIQSWDDLREWFEFFMSFQKEIQYERNCPIASIGVDVRDDQQLLRQDIRLIYEFTRHSLSRFFTSMKACGDLPATVDPDALASLCFTVQQGGMLITKVERDETAFRQAAQTTLNFILSLRTQATAFSS